jgi:hypothetical protein
MTMVAVVYFLAGLTFVAGCGRTITAPEEGACPRGKTLAITDSVRLADSSVVALFGVCVKEGR